MTINVVRQSIHLNTHSHREILLFAIYVFELNKRSILLKPHNWTVRFFIILVLTLVHERIPVILSKTLIFHWGINCIDSWKASWYVSVFIPKLQIQLSISFEIDSCLWPVSRSTVAHRGERGDISIALEEYCRAVLDNTMHKEAVSSKCELFVIFVGINEGLSIRVFLVFVRVNV